MLRRLRRFAVPALCGAVAAVCLTVPSAPAATAGSASATAHPRANDGKLWATQLQFDDQGRPWSVASLTAIRDKGMNSVEINLPWDTLEPSRGQFDFTELDQELDNAAAAGMRIVPIFWQAGWGGSPASWITSREVTNTGSQGPAPAWWDPTEQADYFTYVTETTKHIQSRAGYGGVILNYGRLDAQWSDDGDGGWAPADIVAFHDNYLPRTYGTVAKFNARYGTAYASFGDVPAAKPGEALAGVYQGFRQWSVEDTYGRLTAAVRKVTKKQLYIYFGGHIPNAPDIGNLPDIFFKIAKRYDVTILEDAAQAPGLTLTFASLAAAYRVPLGQEWTAPPTDDRLDAEAVQWISNYGMGLPYGGGEDFFIHDGTTKDVHGYPIYTGWLSVLEGLKGSYPRQPAAVYIDYSQARGNTQGGSLANVENDLTALWSNHQAGFSVVTSEEVANHAVKLSQFKAVLPLNGVDATLRSYADHGGNLLTDQSQLAAYAPAYADLSSAHALQTVPVVADDRRSASITLAEVNPYFPYNGSVVFHPKGLNLRSGTYHLRDAVSGAVMPQKQVADGVCAPVSLKSAQLAQWEIVPGKAPAGTPVPQTCPDADSGAVSVSGTAGQPNDGVIFLGLGGTDKGADGNLRDTTQDGTAAVETWTSAESGAPTSNIYLQLDPSSQPARSADMTLQVTYWASPGQGFRVQYDAPGDAYHGGPTVAGTSSGTWETATVQLTGAQLQEAQNLNADMRLVAADPSQPLIVSKVQLCKGDCAAQ
jgi:Beta-galactosidase